MLPIKTSLDDVDAVCAYLITKPTGATLAEARAVVDRKHLDGRKLSALKYWGLIEEDGPKLKITNLGRKAARDSASFRSDALREIIRSVPPYRALIERVVHRAETSLPAVDVASHWHEHFRESVSDSDTTLNDQALCFFHLAEGADLGILVVGRRGKPTRFDFDLGTAGALIGAQVEPTPDAEEDRLTNDSTREVEAPETGTQPMEREPGISTASDTNRVFITHGSNRKILAQIKQLVRFGKFEPVVAMERETSAKPVPLKVMDDMRTCKAAVIHVGAEKILFDEAGKETPQINSNVLIEIGAAMALYGQNFVLLVEDGLELPSNLQGLYECRYTGEELSMETVMKILEAFNQF